MDHLSLYLNVPDTKSLRPGWKRRATYCFIVLNQLGKEFKRKSDCKVFCDQFTGWGFSKMLPLNKLKEEGVLENNKLIIKVEVKVVEIVHEAEITGKEMFDIKGFNVLYTQAKSVSKIFKEHRDIAVDFKPKNQLVRTAYMNVLLNLIKILKKPPETLSESKLTNARSDLSELTEAGFKLDWLKRKLEDACLERKKVVADGARVQELEERVKTLKVELDNEKAKSSKVMSLEHSEKAKSSKAVSGRKEKAKSLKVLSLEQTVSDLIVELDNEKTKSSKVLLLEQTVLDLKVELDKERSAKSGTSKTVWLMDDACFWRHMGIRERMAGYRKLK